MSLLSRLRSRALGCLCVVGALGIARDARAQDASITVVDVSPGASELEPETLRSQIASELHTQSILPSDPLAAAAQGTLTIDVDHQSGQLTVTYRARAIPITRHVPLPKDAAAARTAAVQLAGNLARDESAEIANTLKNKPFASAPPPVTDENAERDRLQATLDYYADRDRRSREALGWTFVGASALGFGTAAYMRSQSNDVAWGIVGAASIGLGIDALIAFAVSSPFEDLAAFGHQGPTTESLEGAWATAARREHSRRRLAGIIGLVGAGISLGFGGVALTDTALYPKASDRNGVAAVFFVLGVVDGALGIYDLATDGPMESALRAYEASSGRTVGQKSVSLLRHLNVTAAPGGAMGVFATTF